VPKDWDTKLDKPAMDDANSVRYLTHRCDSPSTRLALFDDQFQVPDLGIACVSSRPKVVCFKSTNSAATARPGSSPGLT